ncbi:hypothetical protein CORAM0001_0618 [Corynebacterium amycolatum SK46]|nr:hypothetical protein CORAM0001_0618 [Corynebacterium amycolatum SK46]
MGATRSLNDGPSAGPRPKNRPPSVVTLLTGNGFLTDGGVVWAVGVKS